MMPVVQRVVRVKEYEEQTTGLEFCKEGAT